MQYTLSIGGISYLRHLTVLQKWYEGKQVTYVMMLLQTGPTPTEKADYTCEGSL